MLSAVVIAAGQATRLRPHSEKVPKPLMELAPNVAIIDLTLKQLNELGIKEVIIVVRPKYYEAFKEKLGSKVKLVRVYGEEFGNLYSLKAALEHVGPNKVLLLMSDHIFESTMLKKLICANHDKDVILCLDKKPNSRDLEEGLKVRIKDEKVEEVGKDLTLQDGVDTGLFILSPYACEKVFEFIAKKGKCSTIANFVNELANKGKVGYVDVTGIIWKDIDTFEDLVEARKLYWKIIRRDLYKDTDGPISRYLNRPVSTRLSIFILKHTDKVGPNLMTVVSFLVGIFSALLFSQGMLIVAGLIAHISSVLDGVDGELARLKNEVTEFGKLFDSVLDRFVDVALIISLGLNLSLSPIYLILVAFASAGVMLVSYVSHIVSEFANIAKIRKGFPWATRDVRLFTITLGGLILQPQIPLLFCCIAPLLFIAKVFMSREVIKLRRKEVLRKKDFVSVKEIQKAKVYLKGKSLLKG
jgi:choline kinase/phosphatidylglycerophosphate synthase